MQRQNKSENKLYDMYANSSDYIIKKRSLNIFVTIILVAAYLLFFVFRVWICRMKRDSINFLGLSLHTSPIYALISQFQLGIAIVFIILEKKVGYIIDWIIGGIALGITLMGVLIEKNEIALQGIWSQIFIFIITIVIYRLIKLLDNRYYDIQKQKEEIMKLYSEIAVSESTLKEQKNQLEDFNSILEEREEELNQLAFYDPLTGLCNRRMIIDRIDAMIQIGIRDNREFSVVFFDLDNFKKINDLVGHQVGDEILLEIVKRWKKLIHSKDTFGRLGSDEFALIIQRSLSHNEILEYVKTLRDALNEGIYFRQREFFVKASFGISMFPQDASSSEYLLKYADVAMYESKSNKINKIHFFDQNLQEQFQHNVLLDNYIQQALIRNEISLEFQPQYECNTGKLRGFEALARWNTKKIGLISPEEFIPIAEENGMIISMGEWILRQSCCICKAWMDACHKKFILSVNVSAVQLLDNGFIKMVETVLEETGFDSNYLEMEVTETMFLSSMDSAITALMELKQKGITIALDDFGTGYASLSYLQSLPIDTIKIDKSFIDGILTKKKQRSLVKSLIGISHELSLKVIAEGVEELTQLEFLSEAKCDYIQGFLLGKPLDENTAFEIVQNTV